MIQKTRRRTPHPAGARRIIEQLGASPVPDQLRRQGRDDLVDADSRARGRLIAICLDGLRVGEAARPLPGPAPTGGLFDERRVHRSVRNASEEHYQRRQNHHENQRDGGGDKKAGQERANSLRVRSRFSPAPIIMSGGAGDTRSTMTRIRGPEVAIC